MNRWSALWWPLLWAACAPPADLHLAPPEAGEARSVLFAVESQDEIRLVALPVQAGEIPVAELPLDPLGRSAIWTLFYSQDLAHHGFERGEVEVREDGLPLPRPTSLARSEFLDGRLGPWEEAAISEALNAVRVVRTPSSPCVTFGAERVRSLEHPQDGSFAARLDGRTALVGTHDARLYQVTAEGEVTSLGVAAPVAMQAGYLAPDGDLYLGGAHGRTFVGDHTTMRFTEVATAVDDTLTRFSGAPSGSPEVFAVTASGAFARFDGAWTTLLPPTGTDDWRRGVTWVGPEEGIAVGLSSPVVRWDGALQAEDVDVAELFTSAAHVEGLGTFAGTFGGRLFQRDAAGDWTSLAVPGFELVISAIAPFGDGLLLGGGTGLVTQWYPDFGFCDVTRVTNPIIKYIVVLDETVLFFGDPKEGGAPENNTVVLVDY